MRIQSSATLLSTLLPLASAITYDCAHINVKGNKYDFSPLGGIHEISHVSGNETGSYVTNTTYVLDICKPLGKAATRPEGKCDSSKNICGFVDKHPEDGNGDERWGYSIAGLGPLGEGAKDPEFTLLNEVNEELQGVRLKVAGGKYRSSVEAKEKPAAALIDFKCDPERSGLEGISTTENTGEKRRRAEGEEAKDASLQFKSFGPDDDEVYILKLDWRTRYACDENQRGGESSSSSWGFFTWFIIILFLGIAAYLIFGSWLNYNRYGARGWDLLPHGDTLRDVPYIFQDWFRRVVNTLQGGGTRGGYSAV